MPQQKTLETLFHTNLQYTYYAERQILKALRKMAAAAQSEQARDAFETHEEETQSQIERLQEVFEALGKRVRGKTCPAIEGIIEEGEEVLETFSGSPALDAGLIAAAQSVEHYEIARYGTLKRWAGQLGMNDVAKVLDSILQEESRTDELLTSLAESFANETAAA